MHAGTALHTSNNNNTTMTTINKIDVGVDATHVQSTIGDVTPRPTQRRLRAPRHGRVRHHHCNVALHCCCCCYVWRLCLCSCVDLPILLMLSNPLRIDSITHVQEVLYIF
jgi:hypothetical protein